MAFPSDAQLVALEEVIEEFNLPGPVRIRIIEYYWLGPVLVW